MRYWVSNYFLARLAALFFADSSARNVWYLTSNSLPEASLGSNSLRNRSLSMASVRSWNQGCVWYFWYSFLTEVYRVLFTE